MRVIADLHIHSRYSRATSSRLTPPCLDRWARIKGLGLLGTGDCTHPAWLEELREQLEEAETGLYTIREKFKKEFDAARALTDGLPYPAGAEDPKGPRFVLTGEISTIYCSGGKTRKVHHLVILPDFAAAEAFNGKLSKVGNISSDGRPILGVDSRDLLAMLLDADERAILIPAHIWTPWFSALGAKSGFDSLQECYRDLAPYVHALETGLSSNPPMNWAVESLDGFAIISNSDAHSPDKLGREATIFEMRLSWPSLAAALGYAASPLGGADGIIGTIEFFPQEGKYHYDGHRACGVVLDPEKSAAAGGLCPVCGKPLTYGVMRRVLELAGRPVDEQAPCPGERAGANKRPYHSLIPLRELAAQLLETGEASKKTSAAYAYLVEKAGSEFSLLMDMSLKDAGGLKCPGISGELLALALGRMRAGQVCLTPGYDGEYGFVHVFAPEEKITARKEAELFEENPAPAHKGLRSPDSGDGAARGRNRAGARRKKAEEKKTPAPVSGKTGEEPSSRWEFTPEQEKAVSHAKGHALVIAGPGTGKTAVLAGRIARLVEGAEEASSILAVTFTVKAAGELRERISKTLGEETGRKITAETFHSFCARVLRDHAGEAGIPGDFRVPDEEEQKTILEEALQKTRSAGAARPRARTAARYIEARKRFLLLPGQSVPGFPPETLFGLRAPAAETGPCPCRPREEAVYAAYRDILKSRGLLDFDDLVAGAVRLFAWRGGVLEAYRGRYRHIFVDEYQDINFAQYALLRLLTGEAGGSPAPRLFLIGDPDQAIYGFRGADTRYIDRFRADYPGSLVYHLTKSFRCAPPIILAAGGLTGTRLEGSSGRTAALSRRGYPTEKAEAEGIARRVSRLIGGATFFAFDSGALRGGEEDGAVEEGSLRGLGECAILLRVSALSAPIEKALKDHGIPFHLIGENPWRSLEEEEASSRAARVYVDAVNILTLHAAKGLEFDHVFIAGLEEGILPFTLYDDEQDEGGRRAHIEEEKRLLYVGMTRARIGLHLSWARSRVFQGRKLTRGPSGFLAGLESLVPLKEEKPLRREKDPQLGLF
jgi:superfamily I DNA/RNA helicase/PHP family Zn ribbon phosphoesterase